ncbi:MAG: FapA family protein [Desulfobacterales bacterium]|nr:FapA family protein [Desulfobacterales bacterium]
MTEQPPSSPPPPSDRDPIQDKADILESNLFREISKQDNPVIVRFQVDRETSPDQVIVKALAQLFPRINLKSPKITLLIRKLLVRKIPDGEELKIQKQLLNLSDMGNPDLAHLAVFFRVLVTRELLAVEIKGVPPVPSRDSEIGKAFFDYKRCPGVLSDDGKINFREINKYPIVKKGANLFFITPEVQGKPGIQYDGKVIHVPQALPMDVATRDGVDIVESQKTGGKSRGYFLRAARTGVVILSLANGKIRKIEIRDALDIKRIDYSTGNIGTNFICPISMKIDTICSGFSIRARGTIEVGELEGGTVETDSHAKITMSHPDSRVSARKDVIAHLARQSRLTAQKGRITLVDEMVDTRADGVEFQFEKPRGILSGSVIDAERIKLKGVYVCGDNTIRFGSRLFNERKSLVADRKKLAEDKLERKAREKEMTEALHANIRQLSKILKTNPLLRDDMKSFILAAQTMDYKVMHKDLETIAQTMNTKEVMAIQKLLKSLKKMPELEEIAEAKDRHIAARMEEIEKEMSLMTLEVEGWLRRAGTLRIFTPDKVKEDSDTPTVFVESKKETDTLIKYQGRFSPKHGFQIIEL